MRYCPICGGSHQTVCVDFDSYRVFECKDCGHGVVDPYPDAQMLKRLYNSPSYYASHLNYDLENISKNEIREQVNQVKRLHLHHISQFLLPGSSILEIGCGGGFALAGLEEMGYRATGFETSSTAADFAAQEFGLNIILGDFETSEIRNRYDLVMLNHVFEHFLDPIGAMKKLTDLIAPDGLLYLRVPDHGSFDRKLLRKKWPAYAHYHVSNFTEASLTRLLLDSQLKIELVERFICSSVPSPIRALIARSPGPLSELFTKSLSGRTITMVARKT